jgi:hypothetical protein
MEHGDLKEGARTEVECDVLYAAMLSINVGRALVDPTTLNTEEGFSETIASRMVDAALKKDKKQKQISPCLLIIIAPRPVNELPTARHFSSALGSLAMAIILVQKLLKSQTGTSKIEKCYYLR